jgi:hypothetical protein
MERLKLYNWINSNIARAYDIGRGAVSEIKAKKYWKHVL